MAEISDKDRDLTPEGSRTVSKLYARKDWNAMDGEKSVVITTEVVGDVLVLNATYQDGVQIHLGATVSQVTRVLGRQDPLHFQKARDFLNRIVLSE